MKLRLNAFKAVEEYRKHIEYIASAMRLSKEKVTEKLSLESFAIWFESEFPRFMEAEK